MQLFSLWRERNFSARKTWKCIINNKKIDFSWKVFPSFASKTNTKTKMELLYLQCKKEVWSFSNYVFERKEKEMSSGEQSFHNLYEFFLPVLHQQKKVAARKIVQMAFGKMEERRKGFSCFMKEKHKKRLRILILNFLFSLPKNEMKENGKRENYHTILLCYSKHVKISFWMLHVLIMLFSSFEQARKTAAGIWMWIEKMEAKKFCSTEKCYLFLGEWKWKCQSWNEIYGASSLFWVMIRFYFIHFSVVFFLFTTWEERKGIRALLW